MPYEPTLCFFFRLAAAALSLRKGPERGHTSARKCTSALVSASSLSVVVVHSTFFAPAQASVRESREMFRISGLRHHGGKRLGDLASAGAEPTIV
jgi:hypothetical protein